MKRAAEKLTQPEGLLVGEHEALAVGEDDQSDAGLVRRLWFALYGLDVREDVHRASALRRTR
jgi:hypothetical protein